MSANIDNAEFVNVFGYPSQANASAHGRVNLLGEHTDYNDGFVLPTAIPQQTHVSVAVSEDGLFHLYAARLNESIELQQHEEIPKGFAQYVIGCVRTLQQRGHSVPPIAIYINSEVPMGAGLSSSAALEVATLRALRKLLDLPIDDVEIARLAQAAEIEFAGVRCGIMDQMAASLADTQHMLFLDTRTLERKLLPMPENSEILVLDSGIPRRLAEGAYNQRRLECEEAAKLLGVTALRDVNDEQAAESLPAPLNRRARHVITENKRVLEAVQNPDTVTFGKLMDASHASLRDDFEVSIPELDLLVSLLQKQPTVYGARLTGAGFGGACVALVEPESGMQVAQTVLDAYEQSGQHGHVLVAREDFTYTS